MKKLLLTLLCILSFSSWHANAQLTEGFETWPPTGWTLTSSNTSNDIIQSSSWANSGTYSLRFASYSGASTYDQYAVTPVLETNTGTHIVSFWHRAHYSWGTEEFSVGYSTTGANLSTDFTWSATQTSSTTASEFTLANLPAGTTYVAIHYYSDYSYYMYVDDFSFAAPPSCLAPSVLTASGETTTTVDLAWTNGDGESLWDLELVDVTASGSATGTPTSNDITTNPYTLSGLTANNDYQIYLRADCGGGDASDWVGPVSFSTLCDVVSTFPSTTDFTLNPPTDCWSQAGNGTPAEGPTGTTSSWNAGRSFNGVPSNRVNLYSTGKEEWLISPTYAIPTGDAHELILTLAVTDYNSTSADAAGMAGTDDQVQLLQTLDGGTTWTRLRNLGLLK